MVIEASALLGCYSQYIMLLSSTIALTLLRHLAEKEAFVSFILALSGQQMTKEHIMSCSYSDQSL